MYRIRKIEKKYFINMVSWENTGGGASHYV